MVSESPQGLAGQTHAGSDGYLSSSQQPAMTWLVRGSFFLKKKNLPKGHSATCSSSKGRPCFTTAFLRWR